jgi:phage shock protein PspC (stress-responsive transcriptional regulator)
MNKVITINLNGNAYPLEESGYEALRTYSEDAARALEGNPDRDEIIADIEQSIADKFRSLLGANKTVVASKEVERIIVEMGPVEGGVPGSEAGPAGAGSSGGAAAHGGPAGTAPAAGGSVRRLYRIRDGAMLGGVCNGLAVYFGVDVTIIRIVFVLLAFVSGIGALAYLIMMIVVPRANTPEEMAAATGSPSTAQEFIRRAREGYYEGMKSFRSRREHREWRRKFKQEMRGWRQSFKEEMRANADQWRRNWHWHWTRHPAYGRRPYVATPFVSLLKTLVDVAFLFVVVSLLATRAAFGFHLPGGMHLWLALIILFVAYHVLTWPLRAMKHAYGCGAWGPFVFRPAVLILDFLIWAAVVGFILWYGIHHSQQAHEFIDKIPPAVHDGVDSFRAWWARR